MDSKPIFDSIISNGIFCILFCVLFHYVIKQSSERERQLQNLINDYNQQLKNISETLIKIQEALDKPKKRKKVIHSGS
jgi:septal ring factor EnvC (AmiA/AmiB activator)